jgi:hypothetical protein
MRKIVAFYAWQSDTARQVNSDFVRIDLTEAAQGAATSDSSDGATGSTSAGIPTS